MIINYTDSKDFTLAIYKQLLLALQRAGYAFFTFEEWCDGRAHGLYVILRHDVDLKAAHSLATAQIESELDIKSTYYFRIVPQSNQPKIIRAIADLGHEIGYHYEDLSLFKGDLSKSLEHFEKQLAYFRKYYPVRTICMHGSPTSRFDNRDLWKVYDYRDFGIIGEPYLDLLSSSVIKDERFVYLTDTARMWNGDKYNIRDKASISMGYSGGTEFIHSTFDLIGWINTNTTANCMMITTHPQRWTDNSFQWWQELVIQGVKNVVKGWMLRRKTN